VVRFANLDETEGRPTARFCSGLTEKLMGFMDEEDRVRRLVS
jgi:hypothetical protein